MEFALRVIPALCKPPCLLLAPRAHRDLQGAFENLNR
jgi:hypothetical protein